MTVTEKHFSSMKEFSYEEAQKMLGACALAEIMVVDIDNKHKEIGRVWRSLLADFWVKAKIYTEVAYKDQIPVITRCADGKNYFSGH